MEFTIRDRFVLLQILPEKGNLLQMKLVRQLTDALGFDEADAKTYNIKIHDGGRITWDQKHNAVTKDIELGEVSLQILREGLEKLDKSGQMTMDFLDLCEKLGYGGADADS